MKETFIAILLILICNCNCNPQNLQLNKTYAESILLNVSDSTFIDTTLTFQNLVDSSNSKRIIVTEQKTVGIKTLNNTWNSKYIKTYFKYLDRLNKYAFFSYEVENSSVTIARFYLCDRKSMQTVEMTRFKLVDEIIIGINILPCCNDKFVPVNEFDNARFDLIDQIINE
ncbi:hypothetical protein [Saccharicrinis sp. FJH54]|uniref:hypothetical protein n=1 Tax=Saccharicrinis sp. FJH54 TaxID=3344665 RepID=UPI0035D4498B